MKPIIRVEHLGKRYHLGTRESVAPTLREAFTNSLKTTVKRVSRREAVTHQVVWALSDVGFRVYPGEAVAIIGRNGAGKSTLLKILSRITKPTTGMADLYGRTGSLLEVGTGFHPDLTGRENIYLNGSTLGMKRQEIKRKFDEIVAFAQIDRFLDTPLKRYSSGMYLRLAFAVASHLESEILLLDEVFTVGDALFQKKCLGKMEEVAREGRTVLFVSHSTASIQELCGRVLYVRRGVLQEDGKPEPVTASYLKDISEAEANGLPL